MKLKRGDVREDGWRFWEMQRGKEFWVSPENFTAKVAKIADRQRRRYILRGGQAQENQQYRESNKHQIAEYERRRKRRRSFEKEDGSSFQAWIASLTQPHKVFPAIANLTPDPGQTLAELIHKLSGYAMDVCEQIANPPAIEEAPPTEPTPQPDLF
jgi:hypothetical protein